MSTPGWQRGSSADTEAAVRLTGWDLLSEFWEVFATLNLTADASSSIIAQLAARPRDALFVGAGTGVALRPFAEATGRCLGIDSSVRMAFRCSRRGIPCVAADGASMPLAPASFDLIIVVTGVIDCLDDEGAEAVVAECSRVARAHATLIVAHVDHSGYEAEIDRWGLREGNRVLMERRIELWRRAEREAATSDRPTPPGPTWLLRGFAALRDAAETRGIAFEAVLAALPPYQVIRPAHALEAFLAGRGWTMTHAIRHHQSHVLFAMARRQAPRV